jgi:DNA-binding MarR family transcriptional regulator
MNIMKAFYHKGRRQFVPWLASELATKTRREEKYIVAELKKLAQAGMVAALRVPHASKLHSWHLTPAGQAKAMEIIHAEAMMRSV